jgi:hypothetical protein
MRNIPTKVDNVDELPAEEFNDIPSELENHITSQGITLSASDLQQLIKSTINAVGTGDFYTASGSGNQLNLTPSVGGIAPTALRDGLRIRFRPDPSLDFDDSTTLAITGLTPKRIIDPSSLNDSDYVYGNVEYDEAIRHGQIIEAIYSTSADSNNGAFIIIPTTRVKSYQALTVSSSGASNGGTTRRNFSSLNNALLNGIKPGGVYIITIDPSVPSQILQDSIVLPVDCSITIFADNSYTSPNVATIATLPATELISYHPTTSLSFKGIILNQTANDPSAIIRMAGGQIGFRRCGFGMIGSQGANPSVPPIDVITPHDIPTFDLPEVLEDDPTGNKIVSLAIPQLTFDNCTWLDRSGPGVDPGNLDNIERQSGPALIAYTGNNTFEAGWTQIPGNVT